jgi:hypothetical protein
MVQPAPIFFPAMAMIPKPEHQRASLKRRIQRFYELLNQHDFDGCYRMIDPRIRLKPTSVTLFQYQNALRQFLDQFGSVKILTITIDLHHNEPSVLYEGRDFAVGKTTWSDETGERHVFSERWVREGRAWHTRSTGFVAPATANSRTSALPAKEPSRLSRKRKQPRHVKPG